MNSAPLGRMEQRVLNRIGDIMLPAHDGYPSFSELGCVVHVNDLAGYGPPEDIKALSLLLKILWIKPRFALRMFVWMIEHPDGFPEFMAVTLRQLQIGVRGLVVSLYFSGKKGPDYAGKTPTELMGFELNRVTD